MCVVFVEFFFGSFHLEVLNKETVELCKHEVSAEFN